jgi:hypothetical protein
MYLTNVVFRVKTGVRELHDNVSECLWKPTNPKYENKANSL